MRRTHKQVEYVVATDGFVGKQHIFQTFDAAASFAVTLAMTQGETVKLDVLIYSEAGARFYGGDDAVEQYREDPDASVYERIEIRAELVGSVR